MVKDNRKHITLAEARSIVAQRRGFPDWEALLKGIGYMTVYPNIEMDAINAEVAELYAGVRADTAAENAWDEAVDKFISLNKYAFKRNVTFTKPKYRR